MLGFDHRVSTLNYFHDIITIMSLHFIVLINYWYPFFHDSKKTKHRSFDSDFIKKFNYNGNFYLLDPR